MKIRLAALASAIALAVSSPVAAQLTTFARYNYVDGSGGADPANRTNIQAGTRQAGMQPGITTNNAYVRGLSTRTGVSATADRNNAYATSGIPLNQVGEVAFTFSGLSGLSVTSGGIPGGINENSIRSNAFFINVRSTESPANFRNGVTVNNFSGTIIFKPQGSGTFSNGRTFDSDSVLLAITFQDGRLTRPGGLSSSTDTRIDPDTGGANPDYNPNDVRYFSDYLNFGTAAQQNVSTRDFGITFSASTVVPGTSSRRFTADSIGTFASDPVPVVTTTAVPETATWAMMIIGFGAIGGTLRRRKSDVLVNA